MNPDDEIMVIAEENLDLPVVFIQGILEAKAEKEAGLTEELDWSVCKVLD